LENRIVCKVVFEPLMNSTYLISMIVQGTSFATIAEIILGFIAPSDLDPSAVTRPQSDPSMIEKVL
jgi:hypothetical protein